MKLIFLPKQKMKMKIISDSVKVDLNIFIDYCDFLQQDDTKAISLFLGNPEAIQIPTFFYSGNRSEYCPEDQVLIDEASNCILWVSHMKRVYGYVTDPVKSICNLMLTDDINRWHIEHTPSAPRIGEKIRVIDRKENEEFVYEGKKWINHRWMNGYEASALRDVALQLKCRKKEAADNHDRNRLVDKYTN